MPQISRMWRSVGAMDRSSRSKRGRAFSFVTAGIALMWIGAHIFGSYSVPEASAATLASQPADPVGSSAGASLDVLLARAHRLQNRWAGVEQYYDLHVAPLRRVLLDYNSDPEVARRVAVALVREANRAGLEPRVLLAVLLVENPALDPRARSEVGAVGLMQVMPLHRGHWPACKGSLEDIDTNICYGAQIFASLYEQTGDPERALLRYNGCVTGSNTPDCHLYPNYVYARAGRASLLAWLSPRPAGAASP